jgi:aryl-alcohol dehydrogenase-like predicted oxidoreductase
MQRIGSIAPITSLQPPYSLIRRDVETEILPYAKSNQIGVIAYSPMGSGMLTGTMTRQRVENLPQDDWRTRSVHFQEPLLTRNLSIAQNLAAAAKENGISACHLAILWVLNNPAVTGAIVGVRNAQQANELAKALELNPLDYLDALSSIATV